MSSKEYNILFDRYAKLRKSVAVFGALITAGCIGGIYTNRVTFQQAQHTTCIAGNSGREVVRNILIASKNQKFPIDVTPGSELDRVIKKSSHQNKVFVNGQLAKIVIRDCSSLKPKYFLFF